MTSSDSANETVILIIAGALLAGRNSSIMRKEEGEEELRFWLRCRRNSLKCLKTETLRVKR